MRLSRHLSLALILFTASQTTNKAFEGIDPNLKVLDEAADEKRWEDLNKKGEHLTKETYDSWKEELHNLLIFAGLFSAIVTAFTIEAAKTVQGDPADMTVLLLQTIVLQIHNLTNPQANLPITLSPENTPSLYAQRINVLYSVSLGLSLVAVLGGIVCLQWLREFGRNITGVSNKADLLLQYQRHEGLRTWGVLFVLNMLPLFLLVALGLFFTGFMFSQWESNSLASWPVTTLIVISGAFILFTTVLPTGQLIWVSRKSSRTNQSQAPDVLCPYRSPQSWLFHRLLQGLFHGINCLPFIRFDWMTSLDGIHNWLDYDTTGAKIWKKNAGAVKSIYHALLWISREYRQTTTVAMDAYSCLVAASGLESWMKLKAKDTPNEIKWEWKERDLLVLFGSRDGINDRELVRKIRAKVIIDVTVEWNRSDMSLRCPAPLSDISALEKSVYDMKSGTLIVLLREVTNGLKNQENTWVTEENAVAVASYGIYRYRETTPILQELCKRPSTRSLRHIRHLCDKLRKTLSSNHQCRFLVIIFNFVFPSVDSAHLSDLAPILGSLLVKCDNCIIYYDCAKYFLQIIEDLALKRLIAKECSLDVIFLYTKHVLKCSHGLPEILPSIENTFNAILFAAEEHVRLTPSVDSVLHPDQFMIPRTIGVPHLDSPDKLAPVWALIDGFNKRLKGIWGIHGEVQTGSEGSGQIEEHQNHAGTSDAEGLHPEITSQGTSDQSSETHSTKYPPATLEAKPLIPSPIQCIESRKSEGLEDRKTAGVANKTYSSEEIPTTPGVVTGNPISSIRSSSQYSEPYSSNNSTLSIHSRANEETRLDPPVINPNTARNEILADEGALTTHMTPADGIGIINQASLSSSITSPPPESKAVSSDDKPNIPSTNHYKDSINTHLDPSVVAVDGILPPVENPLQSQDMVFPKLTLVDERDSNI